jgi:hypothetical protein
MGAELFVEKNPQIVEKFIKALIEASTIMRASGEVVKQLQFVILGCHDHSGLFGSGCERLYSEDFDAYDHWTAFNS